MPSIVRHGDWNGGSAATARLKSANTGAINSDLNALIKKLQRIEAAMQKDIKGDLKKAGQIIVKAIRDNAPLGSRIHKRKDIVYRPGNLRKSIQTLPLRRTRNAVIIGPRAKGGLPDGYYARFLEFGTAKMSARPFIDPAVNASLPAAEKFALELLKRRIETYEKQNAV
jgi:HK97 gp10 family phage protein